MGLAQWNGYAGDRMNGDEPFARMRNGKLNDRLLNDGRRVRNHANRAGFLVVMTTMVVPSLHRNNQRGHCHQQRAKGNGLNQTRSHGRGFAGNSGTATRGYVVWGLMSSAERPTRRMARRATRNDTEERIQWPQ